MLYRLYQPTDFAALYAIEEVCFQPPLRFPRGYMRQLVASSDAATWIAEDAGLMTGFAIIEWSRGENEIQAYVQTLEVALEQRGKGIGAQLLGRLEASGRAAGATFTRLHVDAKNRSAIRLYEACGYEYEGEEQGYYAGLGTALIYCKPLRVR